MMLDSDEYVVLKVDVAKIQIDAAILAYEKGNDIVAITLAGAAEEILGKCCCHQNLENAVEKIAELPALYEISSDKRKRISYLNEARNNLKHASNQEITELTICKLDAFVMIVRALENAKMLDVSDSEMMRRFRSGEIKN
jgi:hypothetical protein